MTDLLDAELVDLAAHLDVPDAPMLAMRVRARIDGSPSPMRRRARRRVAVVVAAIAAGGGVALAPVAADWLGIGGVRVRQEAPPVSAVGSALDLGVAVTRAAAEDAVGFELLAPAALGTPDEVWVDSIGAAPIATLVYDGMLLSELRGSVDDRFIVEKFARDAHVELVRVSGARALWIEGAHEVAVLDTNGHVIVERLRLAANVLLWERDGITLRFETKLDRDAAIRIAESVR